MSKIISRADMRPDLDKCGECVAGFSHSERVILFGWAPTCVKFAGSIASGASVAHIATKSTLYVGNADQIEFKQCDIDYYVNQIRKAFKWVLEHHEALRITSVSISLLDGLPHSVYGLSNSSTLQRYLNELRMKQLWISAPTGNGVKSCSLQLGNVYCNSSKQFNRVSFPASINGIVSAGCSQKSVSGRYFYIELNFSPFLGYKTLFAPTSPTSACNAFVNGAAMVVRGLLEKKNLLNLRRKKLIQHIFVKIVLIQHIFSPPIL